MAMVWLFFAVALGCLLVVSFTTVGATRPRWAAAAFVFGVGTAGGLGLTSCIYFMCRLMAPGLVWLGMLFEIALAGAAAWNLWRKKAARAPVETPSAKTPLLSITGGALLFVLLMGTVSMASSWDNNPGGDWDAWAIWNLRARILASPDGLVQRAWSPQLKGTHPEYPLLTSGFIARCWAYGGGATPESVPMATAYLFYLAMCGIGVGALTRIRSASLGLLYGAILAGTPVLIHETTTQYADVPLACYMLGATLLIVADQRILAGLFLGFAAWTKDEGLLFLVVFLIFVAILGRRKLPRVLLGAAAPLMIVLVFKLVLVHGIASLPMRSMHDVAARMGDVRRYTFALGSLFGGLAAMGANFYHPIFPALAAAAILRFDRSQRVFATFCALLTVTMLAAYYAIYVISPDELTWLVGTTVNRLTVQVWPLLLLTVFAAMRAPESMMPLAAPPSAPERRARKKGK